jgi:CHAD domain-containing protein
MAGIAPIPSGRWLDAIDTEGSVADAARLSLEARLMTVAYYLPLAAYHAEQDTEHVHRLRVSTRRAMAALKLYDEWLSPKRARWVKKRLRKVRRTAGEGRDLDVLIERLTTQQFQCDAPVLALIEQRRAAIQPTIVRLAERSRRGDRYVRKVAKLIQSIGNKRNEAAQGVECFRDWAPRQLAAKTDEFLAAIPGTHAEVSELHRFRIRGKALRYSIELLAAAFAPALRKTAYRTIEELQERLGRINDHVTARDRLRGWAADSTDAELNKKLCSVADSEVAALFAELAEWSAWWTPERVEQLKQELLSAS